MGRSEGSTAAGSGDSTAQREMVLAGLPGCRPGRRLLFSTCLLAWSASSLLLTGRLLRTGDGPAAGCRDSSPNPHVALPARRRQVVRGWWDFHGELLQLPDLQSDGVEGFDSQPTEFNMEVGVGRHDSSLQYRLYDQVVVGTRYQQLSASRGVTLCTQASVDKLDLVVRTLTSWEGPLSLAVFVPDREFDLAQLYISYLRSCHPAVRQQVTFSFVHPLDRPPRAVGRLTTPGPAISCAASPTDVLSRLTRPLLTDKQYSAWRTGYSFPQQLLRNQARAASTTHYSLSLDVDIVPAPGLTLSLARFLNGNTCAKCAFVLPTFELDIRAALPRDKVELCALLDSGRARPFHSKIFIHNQFATNVSQ